MHTTKEKEYKNPKAGSHLLQKNYYNNNSERNEVAFIS